MATVHKVAGGAAFIALIAAFIAPNEGERTHAYRDPVGVWTICDGDTQGVHEGQIETPAQCKARLARRIPDYLGPVDRMMPGLPDNRRVAYTDFAYNAGVGSLSRSRIPALERAGRWQEACTLLPTLNTLHGMVLRRRLKEEDLCLKAPTK